MLNKSSITWSAKQVAKMVNTGSIELNHIVQRGAVWKTNKKSALIESIMIGYPIPPFFAKKTVVNADAHATSVYSCLDGKQRCTTIAEFLTDKFSLTGIGMVKLEDGSEMDVNGFKFSELPEELQDAIKDTSLVFYCFDSLTQDEEREMFKRLNNGQPLTLKNKLLASCKNIPLLMELGTHPLFINMLTDKQKENKEQAIIIMKTYDLYTKPIEEICFNGAKFTSFVEDSMVSQEEADALSVIYDAYVEIHNLLSDEYKSKLYTETHFLSFFQHIMKWIDNGLTSEQMANNVAAFFGNMPSSYALACTNGVASASSIKTRDIAIKTFFATRENAQ